jgi:NAD(P)-dependent dehydrogenase (short-subunit alcohol dehydrogenase family)
VVAVDLPSQQGLAKDLSAELGNNFEFQAGDVSSYSQLAHCFSATFKRHGRIDAFCSNAGFIDRSSIYILSHRGSDEYELSPSGTCFKSSR